jgi:hypothetical protein
MTPKVEILEELEGHPVLIRAPYREYRDHVKWLEANGSESYVRFIGLLAHFDGVWVHGDVSPSVFRRVEARVVPRVEYVAWKPVAKAPREFTVAVDFDNVLHSYTSPWSHAADIKDPPLPDALAWLEQFAADGARIILHTCRLTGWNPMQAGFFAGDPDAVQAAIWEWLKRHGLSEAACARVSLWTWVGKPHADAYVDDKAIAFCGDFMSASKLKGMVAYHRRLRIEELGA